MTRSKVVIKDCKGSHNIHENSSPQDILVDFLLFEADFSHKLWFLSLENFLKVKGRALKGYKHLKKKTVEVFFSIMHESWKVSKGKTIMYKIWYENNLKMNANSVIFLVTLYFKMQFYISLGCRFL